MDEPKRERRRISGHIRNVYIMADGCLGVREGNGFCKSCVCAHCVQHIAAWRVARALGCRLNNSARASQPADEFVVESVLAGHRMRTNVMERRYIILHATLKGASMKACQDLVGGSEKMVERHRAWARKEGLL